MTAIFDWLQNNGIDLARLVVQIAILATIVRYGRRLLGTLRASQEQIGALLKLSLSDGVAERSAEQQEPVREMMESPRAEPPRMETPRIAISEPQYEPVFAGAATRNSFGEREQSLGGRVIGAQTAVLEPPPAPRSEAPALTPWVSAPALEPEHRWASHANPEPLHSRSVEPEIPSRGGVAAWLQTPMRSSGVSPMRKVIRWLQAPAGR